jgi:O-antigen/teichoic acid export membrane protein
MQGMLLGRRRFRALAASYVLLAGLRLAGGATAAALNWSVAGALAAATVGTVVAAGVVTRLTGGLRRRQRLTGVGGRWWDDLRSLTAAASATAAILVLTNLDVVLARHYLGASESGQYGVGSLFAKAAFWAPHFLAVLVFPALTSRGSRRRAFVQATAMTSVIGGCVVLAALVAAAPLLAVSVGDGYARAAGLAPRFAVLGVLAAMLQLLLFAGLARRLRRVELLVWAGIAVQVVLVSRWLHDGPEQILLASVGVCASVVAVVLATELRTAAGDTLPATTRRRHHGGAP